MAKSKDSRLKFRSSKSNPTSHPMQEQGKQKPRVNLSKPRCTKSKRVSTPSEFYPTNPLQIHVEDYDDLSIQLFRFDMDVYYGPTIGLTRSERWARAKSLGLKSPPQRVKKHLEDAKSLEKTGLQTSVFEHACQYGICPNARNEG